MKKFLILILVLLLLTTSASALAAEAFLPIRVRIISYEDFLQIQKEVQQDASQNATNTFNDDPVQSTSDMRYLEDQTLAMNITSTASYYIYGDETDSDPSATLQKTREKMGVYYDLDGNRLKY